MRVRGIVFNLAVGTIAVLVLAGAWIARAGTEYQPTTRTYCVAPDEVVWDYTPSGQNQITGRPFEGVPEAVAVQ